MSNLKPDVLVIEISLSSHPEFRYFADGRINGRQKAMRSNDRKEVDEWVSMLVKAAQDAGISFEVLDNLV